MLFRETVAVYFENHTEHIDALCGQKEEFRYVKAGGTYSDHCALIDKTQIILCIFHHLEIFQVNMFPSSGLRKENFSLKRIGCYSPPTSAEV
jgi:hypothetical protein